MNTVVVERKHFQQGNRLGCQCSRQCAINPIVVHKLINIQTAMLSRWVRNHFSAVNAVTIVYCETALFTFSNASVSFLCSFLIKCHFELHVKVPI